MSIIRVNKTKDYSVLSNKHLRDRNISFKAKGVLSLMLSLPEDWDFSIRGLEQFAIDGSTATRSALKELEKLGYLRRTALRENGKIIDWQYDIYEFPQNQNTVVGNKQVDNQNVENQVQQNTIKENKEKQNTYNNIYIAVLAYLNEKAGTRFRAVESNLKFIKARLNDGYTEQDLKSVIDKNVKEWKGTPMQHYLRPETLFNATKFESYINGLETTEEKKKTTQVDDYMQHNYSEEKLKAAMVNFDEWEEEIGDKNDED